jgi:hypothetical protein
VAAASYAPSSRQRENTWRRRRHARRLDRPRVTALRRLQRRFSNGVTTVATPFSRPGDSIGAVRLPLAARGQVREHPAPVLDRNVEVVALKETRLSSQPLDLAANFPSAAVLRLSVYGMICGSRLLMVPLGGLVPGSMPMAATSGARAFAPQVHYLHERSGRSAILRRPAERAWSICSMVRLTYSRKAPQTSGQGVGDMRREIASILRE